MRILKKISAIIVLLALLSGLASCVREKRFDYSELNIRIKKEAPEYSFREKELFYSDGVYYMYYSLHSENDMLLTLKEDENKKLKRITLTMDAEKAELSADDFYSFSKLLSELFIPELNVEALEEATGLSDTSLYTSERMESYTQGFYKAVLFCSCEAACFILLYG